ncbi:hypothetical protein [Rahnella sp. CFA14(1/10)]|uniref:hypothetical protein n=1 Tax=Rahnella sp. CFA14(1/10) TaxID=2511203 RepID=UPI00101E98F6|nr:hypothetical protein [Rahnella sp. CFA14(1/10)]
MASSKSVSFRTHLLSNTLDLMAEIDLECSLTSKLISGIVSQLAAYTEEGVPLKPAVFICNSISALLQRAGVGEYIPLSGDIASDTAGPKILKAAAPLCRDNWRIYIERSSTGQTCKFGVFCGSSDPSSLTVDEVVLDSFSHGFPVIKIAQSAVNKVEVRTNSGSKIEFRFNNDNDTSELNSEAHIHGLANAISANLGDDSEIFSSFVERLLSSAVNNSHGTLIAVISSDTDILPVSLQDAVLLRPSINLFDKVKLHTDEGKTAISVSRLQAAAELVSGFINSDGITIFNKSGCVLGYRAFIRNDEMSNISGGARSRAYESMKQLIGSELSAAFFRSQDGRTDLHTIY